MSRILLPSGKSVFAEKYDRLADTSTPDIPILFIHGLYCTHESYKPVLPLLAEYTRIVYDFEPFGQSYPDDGPLDTVTQARTARELLAHFGYDGAYIVAHSCGTLIGAQTAHDYPDVVRKLVLIAPLHFSVPENATIDWITLPNERIVETLQSWGSKRARDDPVFLESVKAQVETNRNVAEHVYRLAQGLQAFKLDNVSGVKTVTIGGSEEEIPVVDPKGMALALNGLYVEIPGAGHFPTIEEPDSTATALKQAFTQGL